MRNVFFIVSREVEPRQHRTIRSNSIECHYIAGESQTWRKLEIFHLKHNSKETWKIGEKNRRLVKYVDEKWNIIIGDKYRLNQKCIIRSYRKLISNWSLLILRIGFIHLVTSLFFFLAFCCFPSIIIHWKFLIWFFSTWLIAKEQHKLERYVVAHTRYEWTILATRILCITHWKHI